MKVATNIEEMQRAGEIRGKKKSKALLPPLSYLGTPEAAGRHEDRKKMPLSAPAVS